MHKVKTGVQIHVVYTSKNRNNSCAIPAMKGARALPFDLLLCLNGSYLAIIVRSAPVVRLHNTTQCYVAQLSIMKYCFSVREGCELASAQQIALLAPC